jgi:hypothetical protein
MRVIVAAAVVRCSAESWNSEKMREIKLNVKLYIALTRAYQSKNLSSISGVSPH